MRGVTEAKALADESRHRKAEKLERESRLVSHARKNPDVTAKDMATLFRVPENVASRLLKATRRKS